MNLTGKDARKSYRFAEPIGDKKSWDNFATNAEHERSVMTTEFHAWALRKRAEVERSLFSIERHVMEIAPFAQAGIDEAKAPADAPLVVFEFAIASLKAIENKRRLALLNVYYKQSAATNNEQTLAIEPGNEAEINQLWEIFLEERAEKDEKAKAGDAS